MSVALTDVLHIANDEFRRRLVALTPRTIEEPTPCPEWSVGDLVGHVVASNLWVGQLLATGDFERIDIPADVLGDDATAAWEASAALIEDGFAEGLDRRVRHPFGPLPVGRLLFLRCSDTLVHAWDLARALGTDESLDQRAVAACLDILEPIAMMLPATGMYAPPLPVDDDADDQTQLLAMLGRR